jgi:AcrR family transcriptional regulator
MAKPKVEDRRVRKTKRALREGLAELMVDNELRNITVRELTDKVDIHRATFYVHYKDIYDLYNQMEDALVNELDEIIFSNYTPQAREMFSKVLDYILENKNICRMIFSNNAKNAFLDRLNATLKKMNLEDMLKRNGLPKADEKIEFYVQYNHMGCLSIISRWVETDFRCPKDELVELLTEIDKDFDEFMKSKIEGNVNSPI